MDPNVEDLQQQELTALRSIFEDDFIETPPPKAWKLAVRLPEFTIRVPHPLPEHAEKVVFHLNVKFPKTYPTGAYPIFAIQQPIIGLRQHEITKLTNAIHEQARKDKGEQMVFMIVDFAKDWLGKYIKPPAEVAGSLATEMVRREEEEKKAKKVREEKAAEEKRQRETEYAEKIREQIQELERERFQQARKRAASDATEVPHTEDFTPTESFSRDISWQGHVFNRVRLFHPRRECLGTVFQADPVCDEPLTTIPLELLSVTFQAHYYTTNQGRKKLKQVESELQRLSGIRHRNLLSILAVNLTTPNANNPPRLLILSEKRPAITLYDVLDEVSYLRDERVLDYLGQILSGLQVLHNNDIVHRGLSLKCIGIAHDGGSGSKVLKLFQTGYHRRLVDLHRSEALGPHNDFKFEEEHVPDGWMPQVESTLDYTKARDLHSVGIILLQMSVGKDLMKRFPDPPSVFHLPSLSPFAVMKAGAMLAPVKKGGVTCQTLLLGLNDPLQIASAVNRTPTMPHSNHMTPTVNGFAVGSPETDYFRMPPPAARRSSRWKEDWEELELLGRGGFGHVVKAKNKVDNRIYAVKKIKLRDVGNDKIFREVSTLSRLNHRYIVRYYTTWVETSDAQAPAIMGSESEDSDMTDQTTALNRTISANAESTSTEEQYTTFDLSGPDHFMTYDLRELDAATNSISRTNSTFPSIHFARTSSQSADDETGESSEDEIPEEDEPEEEDIPPEDMDDDVAQWPPEMSTLPEGKKLVYTTPAITIPTPRQRMRAYPRPPLLELPRKTLYIQMEFVERQTLRERVQEGLDEDEAWRLFHQIVDALVHMSNLGIIHRDIKPTNIFLDANGDCKVGDFGLATESMDAVDPSDKPAVRNAKPDMTLDVGTRLYMAPEMEGSEFNAKDILLGKKGPKLKAPKNSKDRRIRASTKADMYSLGIVFFEMNYKIGTDSERYDVVPELRSPKIIFPSDWDPKRTRQKQIITWLLQHDPEKRPTAIQLSQSPLLPSRVEDEYVMGALNMIAQADSPHLPAVLSKLFTQPVKPHRALIYDRHMEIPVHTALNSLVIDHLEQIFHLHGAIDTEAPMLMPVTNPVEDDHNRAVFLDRQGEIITLPHNALPPFARAAARASYNRIKRYHICDIYRPNDTGGHPLTSKVAVYDIITPDLKTGPIAAAAEGIAILNQCLDIFGDLSEHYSLFISHSSIFETALSRVPSELHQEALSLLTNTKASTAQKRNNLKLKGVTRSVIEELEALSATYDSLDTLEERLQKTSPSLLQLLEPYFNDIRSTIKFAEASGATRLMTIDPLMLDNRSTYFSGGVCFMAARKNKRSDVLATGGRYDHVIQRYFSPSPDEREKAAIAFQIYLERITATLAPYQSNFVESELELKEPKSFGYWSPRRCDVYVVSYAAGHLLERLEVMAMLWKHNISADVMYEAVFTDDNNLEEDHTSLWRSEGILFMVYVKPRTGLSTVYKVKSVLRNTETEVQSQDLVSYLQHHIAEQKRYDASLSGIQVPAEISQTQPVTKEAAPVSDAIVVLPNDSNKKTRKGTRGLYGNKAFDSANALKSVMPGLRTVAVEVTAAVFDEMAKNANWISSEEALRAIAGGLPPHQSGYAQQIRDAILRLKADGQRYVLLYGIRQDRIALLTLA